MEQALNKRGYSGLIGFAGLAREEGLDCRGSRPSIFERQP